MKKVHLITDKEQISDFAATPVRHNKKTLYEKGYNTKIFYKLNKKNLSCNILALASKPVLNMLKTVNLNDYPVYKEPHPVISFLKDARKYADKIIWMDDSDSTGVTHFELLPYIDLYLKKQLLKDKTLYQKEFYGGRIWSDFYRSESGIVDTSPFIQFYSLDTSQIHKVRLSWNIGLGNMYNSYTKKDRLRRLVPDYWPLSYKVPCINPDSEKAVDIFIRMSAKMARESLLFHRTEVLRRLKELSGKDRNLNFQIPDWLPFKQYNQMMRSSKIVVSPFGWGELGGRDYTAFICGASLLKPKMEHMETWPNIFIENVTYQPFSWGFEDFESAIYELLKDDKKRIEIARNGQQAYLNSISPAGMENFCNWFIKQIED